MNWRKALFDASPWLTTIGLFMLWEAVCRVFAIPPFILPAPSQAAEALIEYWPGIWLNASHTFMTTLIGFAIAVVFGVALGVAVGASPLLYRALNPVLIGFNSIPKVAVVPILVLWFGIGTVPAVLTAFLVAFFPDLRERRDRNRDHGAGARGCASISRCQQARRPVAGGLATLAPVFFCITQDCNHAGIRRSGHFRDRRFQSRHRLPHDLGKLDIPCSAGFRRPARDCGDGNRNVRCRVAVRASTHPMGDPKPRQKRIRIGWLRQLMSLGFSSSP